VSRHRFETYLDKVFGFSDLVSALPEGRQSPWHHWKKVFDAVFLGAAMQIPSLLQIEAQCRDGALAGQTDRTDQRRHHRLRARKTISRRSTGPSPTAWCESSKRFSRSRWRIDTEVFQTITTDCHLKHPAIHQTTALVVLTMIRFLAYTLSLVFYRRQVRSHARGTCETFHECAKRISCWFLAPAANTS
jgi:hypothetical protein